MLAEEKNWLSNIEGGRVRLSEAAHKELSKVAEDADGKAVRVRIAGFG